MKNTWLVFITISFFLFGCTPSSKQPAPEYQAMGQAKKAGEKPISFMTRTIRDDMHYGRVFSTKLDAANSNADILFFNERLLLAEANDIWDMDPKTGEKKGSFIHITESISAVASDTTHFFIGTQNTLFKTSGNSDIIIYNRDGKEESRFKMASSAKPDALVAVGDTLYVLTYEDIIERYEIATGKLLGNKAFELPRGMNIVDIQANERGIVLQAKGSRYDDILLLYSPTLDERLITLSNIQGYILTAESLYYNDDKFRTLNRFDLSTKQNQEIVKTQYKHLFVDHGFMVGVRNDKTFDLLDETGRKLLEKAAFPLFEQGLKQTRVENGRFALLSPGMIAHKIELWDFSTFIKKSNQIPQGVTIDSAYPFESIRKLYEALPEAPTGMEDRLQVAYDLVLGDAFVFATNYSAETNELNITLASTGSEYETTFTVPGIDLAQSKVWNGLKEKLDIRAFFSRDILQPQLEKIIVYHDGKTYPTIISEHPFISKTAQKALDEAKRTEALNAAQACRLKHDKWFYESSECKGNLAHGLGKARLMTDDNVTFEGSILEGIFVNGTLFASGERLWVGPFSNGKPDGRGVCFNEGEPESCEFFEGKQIDALYIQRKEMEKLHKKIAKLEAKQRAMETQLSKKSPKTDEASSSSIGEKVGEAVAREIGKAFLQKLFDGR